MPRLCLLVLLLSSCTAPTLNYAGKLVPASGVCDPAIEATLTLRGAQIVFAPAAGTLLLRGVQTGGAITASLTMTDANKRPYTMTFHGTEIGSEVTGTYETPRCTYSATLRLTQD